MTLYFFSDHTCLDLHLELNFNIDLARKANTRLASTRISHETPHTGMEYHVHVHSMHDWHALQIGLSVWIYIQQRLPGKFMSSQTVSPLQGDDRWPQRQKQSQGELPVIWRKTQAISHCCSCYCSWPCAHTICLGWMGRHPLKVLYGSSAAPGGLNELCLIFQL